MKSQGEIESAVCDDISRFQQEFAGRGPTDIHSHLVGSLLVVRLQGTLTAAERQLLAPRCDSPPLLFDGQEQENGRSLLKQVRSHMVVTGRQRLRSVIEEATGVSLISVHHDISTVTGEELFAFSLATSPSCRPKKQPTRTVSRSCS